MATLHIGELLFHSLVLGDFLLSEGVVSAEQRPASSDPSLLTMPWVKLLSSMVNLNEQLREAVRGACCELFS